MLRREGARRGVGVTTGGGANTSTDASGRVGGERGRGGEGIHREREGKGGREREEGEGRGGEGGDGSRSGTKERVEVGFVFEGSLSDQFEVC